MSKHRVASFWPPPVDYGRFGRNGMVPQASQMQRLAEGFNFIAARPKKQVLMKCQRMSAVAAGDAGDEIWPCYFQTGEATTTLRILAGVVRSDYDYISLSLAPPELGITVKDSGGSTVAGKSWSLASIVATVDVVPQDIHHIHDFIEGLSPNTEYYLQSNTLAGSRVVYLSVTELDSRYVSTSTDAITSPAAFVDRANIYSDAIADLITANNRLWRHNGAHLIEWCLPYQLGASGSGVVVNGTSFTNVLDGSSTSVSSSTPGFSVYTQYHNTTSRTSTPVKWAVKCRRTAGAGTLQVRFTDGTNSLTTTAISGTPATDGWVTGSNTMEVTSGSKWDMVAKVSAGGTAYDLQAVHVWEYEA